MDSPETQRDYPEDLPTPYLRFHNSPQGMPSGRAPVQSNDSNFQVPDGVTPVIPRMPTAEELAVTPIPEGFRCPLCLDVLDQPTTTVPCGHTFCERCILQSLNENREEGLSPTASTVATRCPVCRSVVRKHCLGPCWIVRELIDNIVVRCDYGVSYDVPSGSYEVGVGASGGCTSTFKLSNRSLHLQECGFVMMACKYSRDGCPAMSRRSQIRSHEAECVYRSEDCKCGQRIRTQAWGEHLKICPSVEVQCPHKHHGCPSIFMRKELESHLSSCAYAALKELLAEKDKQIKESQMKNIQLESSLWSALKRAQQLEQETIELRKFLGMENGSSLTAGSSSSERPGASTSAEDGYRMSGNSSRSTNNSPQRTSAVSKSQSISEISLERPQTLLTNANSPPTWASNPSNPLPNHTDLVPSSLLANLHLETSGFRSNGPKGHPGHLEGGPLPPEREKNSKSGLSHPRYRSVQALPASGQWRQSGQGSEAHSSSGSGSAHLSY